MRVLLLFLALAAVNAQNCCPHVASMCEVAQMADLDIPPGFCLNIFGNVNGARGMDTMFHPQLGAVAFVGSTQGNMNVLIDADQDGRSDRTITFPLGQTRLHNPKVSPEGDLWVGQGQNIRVFDNIFQHLTSGSTPQGRVIYNGFGTSTHHGHRYVNFSPEEPGMVYMSSGAPCNVCIPNTQNCPTQNCHYGTIVRANYTGKPTLSIADIQIFSEGVRNSVGFDFNPVDNALWFTDNGRDNWGNDRPPDELNRASATGQHFGFPYCHGLEPDPGYNNGNCNAYIPPAVSLGPHIAALGMTFYKNYGGVSNFPPPYNSGIFIAEHGSWNRNPFLGFRLTHVAVSPDGSSAGDYKIFLDGFLQNTVFGTRWGRPADIQELPDGSLIFSDDYGNRVFRISYAGAKDLP